MPDVTAVNVMVPRVRSVLNDVVVLDVNAIPRGAASIRISLNVGEPVSVVVLFPLPVMYRL